MKQNEKNRTKQEAQAELVELFDIKNTAEFRTALQKGDVQTASAWLQHIIDHKKNFPQYHETWDSWLTDRKQEISQAELFSLFGIRNTAEFRQKLQQGKIILAEKWLKNIKENRFKFPNYDDGWISDRQQEIDEMKK